MRSKSLRSSILAIFVLFGTTRVVAADKSTVQPVLNASELALPAFQESSLERDLPVKDIFFASANDLWILGKRSLWSWNLPTKKLRRIPLISDKTADPGFSVLGTDGVSLFAAGANTLFQIQLSPKRVFLYRNPFPLLGNTLGLAGQGEQFYWLHTTSLMQLDRYGKALIPKVGNTPLKEGDHVVLDPSSMELYFSRGKKLIRVDLGGKGGSGEKKERVIFKAEHPLLDLKAVPGGHDMRLIVHTAHTVLILDRDGKVEQAIPVEGTRTLKMMNISSQQHTYLFSDSLLEVFQLKRQVSFKYRLPLDSPDAVSRIAVLPGADGTGKIALVEGGRLRVFNLATTP